ncbi:MAG: arginase family protein [Caldilineaceae bacterium]
MAECCRCRHRARFLLALGGDHSMAAGSVAGAARSGRGRLVDAHADFNTTPKRRPAAIYTACHWARLARTRRPGPHLTEERPPSKMRSSPA